MKGLIQKVLSKFGLKLIRIPRPINPEMINIFIDKEFEEIYKSNNFVFADIGARDGIPNEWKVLEKHLKVIGFEPDIDAYEELLKKDNKNITYYNIALFNEKATLKINITRGGGQSSIFTPNRNFLGKFHELPINRWDVIKTEKIFTNKLDNILEENYINDLDYIKIDTQGSEKNILEGAINICKESVFALEVEAFFLDAYTNQPVFSDVDSFLRKIGFYLFDLRKYYWRRNFVDNIRGYKGQLIFCDALYLKNIDSIPLSIAKYLKAISICILYGYFDYALEITNNGKDKYVFNKDQHNKIKNALIKYAQGFKGIINYDDETQGNYPWF